MVNENDKKAEFSDVSVKTNKQKTQKTGGVFLLEMAVNQYSHRSRVSDERSSNFA